MGLGSKIKHALHGDDHTSTTTSNARAPGAYPSEEYLGKSNDNDRWESSAPKHTTTTVTTSGANNLDYSTSKHSKLHKDTAEDYDPYKDDVSPKSATSQRSWDSGVGGINKTNGPTDRTSTGGYWGDMASGSNNKTPATKDLPDRTRYSQDGAADRRHDPRVADQAVGGGVYNGVTGTRSHNHHDGHHGQFTHGAVHDPLTSSTKGVPVSDDGYDDEDLPEHNVSSSHNQYPDRSLNGKGLKGSGLNGRGLNGKGLNSHGLNGSGLNGRGMTTSDELAGAATGYEGEQRLSRDNYTYGNPVQQPSSYARDGGVPKTSMLDPEPAATMTSPTHHNTSPRAGGFSSAPTNERFAQNSSDVGPSVSSSSSNRGKSHFGPGHEGAKVLHQCEHCGGDNDISRYFRNDVVYRLGSN